MADRMEMMFEILMGIQADLRVTKRKQPSQGIRLSSIKDHICEPPGSEDKRG